MLEPQSLYNVSSSIRHDPSLRGLPLIAGFTGFVDAGQVVAQVRDELLGTLDHEVLASSSITGAVGPESRSNRIICGITSRLPLSSGFSRTVWAKNSSS